MSETMSSRHFVFISFSFMDMCLFRILCSTCLSGQFLQRVCGIVTGRKILCFPYLFMCIWTLNIYFILWVIFHTTLFILLLQVLALTVGSSITWLPFPSDIPKLFCVLSPFPLPGLTRCSRLILCVLCSIP